MRFMFQTDGLSRENQKAEPLTVVSCNVVCCCGLLTIDYRRHHRYTVPRVRDQISASPALSLIAHNTPQ